MDVPMPRRQDAESGRFLSPMDVPMPRRQRAESGRSNNLKRMVLPFQIHCDLFTIDL